MKSKSYVQSDEDVDTLGSYTSMTYDDKTMEVVQYRQENFFQFGSSIMAVIYMANTMLIPNMNQLFIDVSFDNPLLMVVSVIMYWLLSFLILIPCYLVIKICKQEGNPIYAYIIKQDSIKIYNVFIYSNLILNTLGLFNIIVRLGDSLPKVNRWFYIEFHHLMASEQAELFFPTIICYTAVVLTLFYGFYKCSYFEQYYDIQYRLIISFVGKIILNTVIFLLIYYEVPDASQEYISMDENLFDSDFSSGATQWITYCFNQICCISYPFFEVFYLKRETKKGYSKVQQCYWIQLLLRSLIFLLDHYLGNHHQIRENEVLLLAIALILKFTDDFLISMSITSIYSHNYTLNKEIQEDNIQTATEDDNKKQIKEIYLIAAGLFVIEISICIICRFLLQVQKFLRLNHLFFTLIQCLNNLLWFFMHQCTSIFVDQELQPQVKYIQWDGLLCYHNIYDCFVGISSEPFFSLKS